MESRIQWTGANGFVYEIITTHYSNGAFISKMVVNGR